MEQSNTKLCGQIIDFLLKAYFKKNGPDRMKAGSLSFRPQLNRPTPLNFIDQIFRNPSSLIAPALLLRCKGPSYLNLTPLESIKEKLSRFFDDNYYHIRDEMDKADFEGSLFSVVSQYGKTAMGKALEESEFFSPKRDVFCFPLTPIRVEKDFDCDHFYFIDLASPAMGDLKDSLEKRTHLCDVKAWLGVRAPSIDAANRMKRIVLGALALSVIHRERHQFTIRKVAENYLKLDGKVVITSSSNAHTPPIGNGIVIAENEHVWLRKLALLISS